MTYVEFFDKTAVENVFTCLGDEIPDRVILIGDDSALLKHHADRYARIFRDRGREVEFITRSFFRNKLDRAVEMLREIVDRYGECLFDITGGDEILTLALGIVCEQYRDKPIGICRCSPPGNATYYYWDGGMKTKRGSERLSVAENVRLYGGDVVYGGISEQATYVWDLSSEFCEDVERLWDVCRAVGRDWNRQLGVFAAIEETGTVSADGLTTVATRDAVDTHLRQFGAHFRVIDRVVRPLLLGGHLVSFAEQDGEVTVSYKDPQIKRCLTVAGQILELTVYLTAGSLNDEDGSPMYDDALNGVVIDWDGKRMEQDGGTERDTENEIDVLLMHNTIPIFISCKNGGVTAEELYKLEAVADRFGGKYAKKVLVATAIPEASDAAMYFRQRARDMGILLIEGIQKMSREELQNTFSRLWDKS